MELVEHEAAMVTRRPGALHEKGDLR